MNIGVIPASHMNFDGHIKNIYSVAFYHIRNIAKIKKNWSYDPVKTLMHAFVTPQIYSSNTLFLPNLETCDFTKFLTNFSDFGFSQVILIVATNC